MIRIISMLLALQATVLLAAEKRESIFDRIVNIEDELILDVPNLPPLCDKLDLQRQKINIGPVNLYVEQEGQGIPIVLLHGGPGGTHHGFHPFFSRAKKFAKIIYYDQRGTGQSDYIPDNGYTVSQAADDLDLLRKKLGIEKWVILGHSYGGFLAQVYMLKYPQNILGVILVSAETDQHLTLDRRRLTDFLSEQELVKLREIASNNSLSMEQKAFNMFLNGYWKAQHFYKFTLSENIRFSKYYWKQDTDFNRVMSENMFTYHLVGQFNNSTIPTLMIEGLWDLTWNTDKPQKFHDYIPNATLVVFENSGHQSFVDEPEKFFSLLQDFVSNIQQEQ